MEQGLIGPKRGWDQPNMLYSNPPPGCFLDLHQLISWRGFEKPCRDSWGFN